MRSHRGHPDHEIEDREADVTEVVLDVVAEDPQEQHVARDVKDGAVQEHGRDDCEPDVLAREHLP